MDRLAFETALHDGGYEIVTITIPPNKLNDDHAHGFDAYVMVVAGQMTVVRNGEHHAYGSGDTFRMEAGCRHSELAGPDGTTYIAGRRARAA
jgi:quercetin dioxygenase-like cupin family protein